MSEERKDQIIKVLSTKGALGVNAIAREIGVNVSTLQKYLVNQTYFKQNEKKHWDLPENVVSDVRHNQLEMLATVAESSVGLIRANVEELLINIDNALSPLKTLKRDIVRIQLPVANKVQGGIHPKWDEASEMLAKFPDMIKSRKSNLSEENYEMLQNVDWYHLYLDMGANYFINVLSGEVYNLLLGETDTLSEDALITVKEYVK